MAEHGFYHPQCGYWQTIETPSQAFLDGYPAGTVEVPLKPGADYEWIGTEWVHNPPPDPTPEELRAAMPALTARQFRLGLLQGGHAPTAVEAQIALIADPDEKAAAEIEWEYATKFERLHPLVISISAALGLSATEVDALWTGALEL